MAIDFPSAPINGQEHTSGGVTYVYNGTGWVMKPGASPYVAKSGDTMSGLLTLSGDPTADLHAVPKRWAAPFAALDNGMQVNGSMEVSQEKGAAATTASNNFIVDSFAQIFGGTMLVSSSQVADAPPGFANSIKVTVTTAQVSLAASDQMILSTTIEHCRVQKLVFGTANAQPVTLAFWTKIHRPGIYSGAVKNAVNNRSYPFTFTQSVADVWEYKTVTVPGDTTGAWAVALYSGSLTLVFSVAAGTTHQAPANAWVSGAGLNAATGTTNGVAATSDTFQLTGVCMLPGTQAPTAAQSPLIMRSFDQELVACQRYFWKPNSSVNSFTMFATGYAQTSTSALFVLQYPVRMRTTPTVSFSAAATFFTQHSVTTITSDVFSDDRARINASCATATVGDGMGLSANSTLGAYIAFDARV